MLLSLKGFNDTLNKFWTVGGIAKNTFLLKTIKIAYSEYKIGWLKFNKGHTRSPCDSLNVFLF